MIAEKIHDIDFIYLKEDHETFTKVAMLIGVNPNAFTKMRKHKRMCKATYVSLVNLVNKARRKRNLEVIKL